MAEATASTQPSDESRGRQGDSHAEIVEIAFTAGKPGRVQPVLD